ncbi:hypothetical protein BAE44_0011151 [Dichanthelium oligosanthes]|uniref:Chitin-binding type-1 domain-containing protein n=1 Tax=Dichanthelium oligosanthes TaxID=888268 RepID=A0A1E5VRS4_9POAL|nr:hypothetical protein BAE44_0011151 [Dichanthelium oligosanthes]
MSLATAFPVSADVPQCGPLAGGKYCPNGLCCSSWGFCGTGPAYCDDGQSLAVSARAGEQCGRQAGGKLCPNGLCCSKWGFCGSTPDYCGDGCQSQCKGGREGGESSLAVFARAGEQCGSQAGGKLTLPELSLLQQMGLLWLHP